MDYEWEHLLVFYNTIYCMLHAWYLAVFSDLLPSNYFSQQFPSHPVNTAIEKN